jgi:hypothetical protein
MLDRCILTIVVVLLLAPLAATFVKIYTFGHTYSKQKEDYAGSQSYLTSGEEPVAVRIKIAYWDPIWRKLGSFGLFGHHPWVAVVGMLAVSIAFIAALICIWVPSER